MNPWPGTLPEMLPPPALAMGATVEHMRSHTVCIRTFLSFRPNYSCNEPSVTDVISDTVLPTAKKPCSIGKGVPVYLWLASKGVPHRLSVPPLFVRSDPHPNQRARVYTLPLSLRITAVEPNHYGDWAVCSDCGAARQK